MTPDAAADIEASLRETAALLLTASSSLSALADVIARAMDPGLRGGVWAKPVGEMATSAGDDEPASHPFAAPIPAAAPVVDDSFPWDPPPADVKPACEVYWHGNEREGATVRAPGCPGCEWLKARANPDDGRPGWEPLPVPDVHVAAGPEAVAEALRDDGGPEHVKRVFDGIADLRDKIGEALAADDAKRTRKPAAWEPPGRVKITLAGLGIDAAAMLPRYREATADNAITKRGRERHFREWCVGTHKTDREVAVARGEERP